MSFEEVDQAIARAREISTEAKELLDVLSDLDNSDNDQIRHSCTSNPFIRLQPNFGGTEAIKAHKISCFTSERLRYAFRLAVLDELRRLEAELSAITFLKSILPAIVTPVVQTPCCSSLPIITEPSCEQP